MLFSSRLISADETSDRGENGSATAVVPRIATS